MKTKIKNSRNVTRIISISILMAFTLSLKTFCQKTKIMQQDDCIIIIKNDETLACLFPEKNDSKQVIFSTESNASEKTEIEVKLKIEPWMYREFKLITTDYSVYESEVAEKEEELEIEDWMIKGIDISSANEPELEIEPWMVANWSESY